MADISRLAGKGRKVYHRLIDRSILEFLVAITGRSIDGTARWCRLLDRYFPNAVTKHPPKHSPPHKPHKGRLYHTIVYLLRSNHHNSVKPLEPLRSPKSFDGLEIFISENSILSFCFSSITLICKTTADKLFSITISNEPVQSLRI